MRKWMGEEEKKAGESIPRHNDVGNRRREQETKSNIARVVM